MPKRDRSAYMREYRKRTQNKSDKMNSTERVRRLRERKQKLIKQIKNTIGCKKCKKKKIRQVYFIHKDTKEIITAPAIIRTGSWEDIAAKIKRCTILCGDCKT